MELIVKPKITPWDEATINKVETFKVFKPTRINTNDGKGCRPYKKGEEVSLSGSAKKDLYFQNKIFYPEDFEKVVAFEKASKKNFEASANEAATEHNVANPGAKKLAEENAALKNQIGELSKSNTDLQKQFADLAATVEELKKNKK